MTEHKAIAQLSLDEALVALAPEALGLDAPTQRHRIVVAMSGGVDSSLVAGLAAKAGYETVGITLQLYDHGQATARKGACCAGQDIMDAKKVARKLGISHYVLNYEDRFRQAVIDDFADSYLKGETPLPCVRCNQTVKFSDLFTAARELGASALLTGHYLISRPSPGGWRMFQARDGERDQSYFLFATTQEQLDYLRFPLGAFSKAQTRALAAAMELPVAQKSDSQDICFVPNGDYASLIAKLRPNAVSPGELVHVDGRVLGRHGGIVNFTVGQRKGLGIALGEPVFVVRIEPETRRVIVGPRDCLRTRALRLKDVNWLGDDPLEAALQERRPIHVKVRSTQAPRPARLGAGEDGAVWVRLDEGEFGVALGQACVFYEHGAGEARVLGGGFIAETLSDADAPGEL